MTRIHAVSLFLIAVLVLVNILAALVADELPSSVVFRWNRESSVSLEIGAEVPVDPSVIACGGCSGGGGTGG